ncbi:MAG TPA: alpha-hydroxy-acid oxidizing protein [Candidatus Dormibacteraeota bacterium]|nr:alpha-hydroxy-acid oxidizing protein [Candidatus Dormibacteraeota bacterium]
MPDSPHSVPKPTALSPGMQRQFEIYQLGLAGKKLSIPIPLLELERKAAEVLSPQAYDYVAGSASGERTARANLAAFERWRIVPRMLRDVSERDLTVELLGHTLPAPVLLGPVGVQNIIHPDAELAVARAAASLGVPFVLSTVSSRPIEEIGQSMAAAPHWFQLYWGKDHELTASLLSRAENSGYSALVVTLDTAMLGWRERDLRHPYLPFLLGHGLTNYFTDPVFCSRLKQPPSADPATAIRLWASLFSNTALTWKDLAWLRRQTRLPILVKGILHADDARLALDHGVDGIIVSNHGGRQVDGAIASLDALPAVASAIQQKIPILFDSGIRYGADAIKALALGARAVLLGRLYIWGLAVAGEQGVRDVVQNLLADLDLTMGLSGLRSVKELDSSVLTSR